ncbi:hypothetical protein RhiirA5_483511 [Rhizophagus irregularis]|uniref:Uncharacterized protein n=1 Tax=Rhizophagus irregularis TaxID=588596 RepID=A0A2I1E701_9GLOM|nr:hypothetical protein RhiirA5_483511 [Rhizophagus irregularis]PKY17893.1 hypothetical protein RhiirB3_489395 [Rhizophagus irregularis]CAB5125230.1 unnamed protein product [Rhizophagus irregularis]CAB5381579.1 unnamed protein product [Rhizophagus irregularis]
MSKVSTTSVSSTISAPSRQREPADSLGSIHHYDWKIFMWIASLKEIESLIYLFIIVWNAISLRKQNHARLSEELADETNSIIRLIKELATLKALSNEREVTIIKTLDDYKNCRLSEKNSLRNTLSDNAWEELESFGLPYDSRIFEKQLNRCLLFQKGYLRRMILSRMESFLSIAKQIEINKLGQETKIESTESIEREMNQNNVRLVVDTEWRDNDKNNSMQLVKDIESLSRSMNKITGVKRNVKEIKEEAVAELFSSLGCNTTIKDKQMKLVLDSVLQRHLIHNILDSANHYLKDEDNLEAAIRSKIEELINLVTRFEDTNLETNENAQTLPTILRQQNYATLGHRVFSKNHSFINQLVKDLANEMNKYRILDSDEKNKKFEDDIIKIIIQFLRIFYFRLKTQEPIPSFKFYDSGDDIDPCFMDGMWEGHCEDYVVEICSFPAIIIESDERAYTRAQVIARLKEGLHEDEELYY